MEAEYDSEIPRSEVELWMKKATEQTLETLPAFTKEMNELIPTTYGNCVHKTAIASVAISWAMNKELGLTGFQASEVMWEYITYWMNKHNPLKLLDYSEMLYPQYSYKFTTMTKSTHDWLKAEARKTLEKSDGMHPDVREHMEQIIMGKVPFGYKVKD